MKCGRKTQPRDSTGVGKPALQQKEELKMRTLLKRSVLSFAILMLLGAGQALASPAAPSADTPFYFSERATTLLTEIQSETAAMKLHTETLGTFAWKPQISWQSHAHYLDRVKGHINNVGERIAELQAIRGFVQPWQQTAIDKVTVHAVQVASSTRSAIVYLRGNQGRLFVPEYRDHLTSLAARSDDMKETLDKYLEYGKAQDTFQHLRNALELERD
jgi:hypothetical protein